MNQQLTESRASQIKELIKEHLINNGYGTYAQRLSDYKFVIADFYYGQYVPVAAMFPETADLVINPAMVDVAKIHAAGDLRDDEQKLMDQLSVLIRHELLHFLLVHQKRLIDHLTELDPAWQKLYNGWIANQAMDYEISIRGYDADDMEVVRLMTLNNQVVGGLIAEDDHPEWGKKTMEEIYDILHKEHQVAMQQNPQAQNSQSQLEINIKKASHPAEYTDMYNKIINLLDVDTLSDADLDSLIDAATNNADIINPLNGEVLLVKGA